MDQRPALRPKAMILAAGVGTRLRPLTYETPKPMVPVANRPVLDHVLRRLAEHGVKEACLNVWSFPEQIREFCGDGRRWGLRLSYSFEKTLLGTAGAVKKVQRFLGDGPFFVLSGDGLHDVDLSKLWRFHRKRRSMATMVTKSVDARFEYGVALAAKNGRIKGFLEKPSWGRFFSSTANTGIYLFEPEIFRFIPPRRCYDFGQQVWPSLLKKNKRIFAWEWKGYWTDVGNLVEYRRAQRDVLDRNVDIDVPGKQVKRRIWVEPGAKIAGSARLIAPCLVGARAKIGPRAVVGPYSQVGAGVRIGPRAEIKNSILFDGSVVGAGAYLSNCTLGPKSRVNSGSAVYNADVLNSRN